MVRSYGLNAVFFFVLVSTVNAQNFGPTWTLPSSATSTAWVPSSTAWWVDDNPTDYNVSTTGAVPTEDSTDGDVSGWWFDDAAVNGPQPSLATVRMVSTYTIESGDDNYDEDIRILFTSNPPESMGNAPAIGARLKDEQVNTSSGGNRDKLAPEPDANGIGTTYSACQTFWAIDGSERTRTLTCKYQPKVPGPMDTWDWGGDEDCSISNYHFAEASREQWRVDRYYNPGIQDGLVVGNCD